MAPGGYPQGWPVSMLAYAHICRAAPKQTQSRSACWHSCQRECFKGTANGGFCPVSLNRHARQWSGHSTRKDDLRKRAGHARCPQLQLQCVECRRQEVAGTMHQKHWVEDHQSPIGFKLILQRTNHADEVRRRGSRRDVSIRRTAPRRGWKRATGLCLVHFT